MHRRTFARGALGVATGFVAGCAGGQTSDGDGGTATGGGTATSADTPAAVVEMVGSSFEPRRLDVSSGSTVEWRNGSSYGHTVTATQFHDVAASWSFEAEVVGGASATYTFDSAGVYEYYCTVHGEDSMCGVVLVDGATLDPSLPCEGDDGT